MGRRIKKKPPTIKKNNQVGLVQDVTINDYANNEKPVERIKKSSCLQGTAILKSVDNESTTQTIDTDSHSDGNDESSNEGFVDIDINANIKKKNKLYDNIKNPKTKEIYRYIHTDIWYLISEHIEPDDIGRFAGICRQTAQICQSAKFWKHLYKKYYRLYDENTNETCLLNLPVRLQPDCMVRKCGLRTCTIRSFFYTYPSFVERLNINEQTEGLFALIKRECVASWMVQVKEYWHYCFKLKERFIVNSRLAESAKLREQNNFEKVYNDIYQNIEENCKILVVKTQSNRPLPHLFGQQAFLGSINHSLTQNMINYKLSLTFVAKNQRDIIATVNYDPIVNIRVLDWWTPSYYSFISN